MLCKRRQRGLKENSELAIQGTILSLTITACSAAQQGHHHHARQVSATSGIFFFLSLLADWQCFYLERISIRPLLSGFQACIHFAARSLVRTRITAPIILSFAEWRARTSFHLFSRCQGLTYRSLCLTSNVKECCNNFYISSCLEAQVMFTMCTRRQIRLYKVK